MDINIDDVSYVHMGAVFNYLVLKDSALIRLDKRDKFYQDIRAHSNFIRISRSTYVNYFDVETITSILVRMYCGKDFGYGWGYRKAAIGKYLKIYQGIIWNRTC